MGAETNSQVQEDTHSETEEELTGGTFILVSVAVVVQWSVSLVRFSAWSLLPTVRSEGREIHSVIQYKYCNNTYCIGLGGL